MTDAKRGDLVKIHQIILDVIIGGISTQIIGIRCPP